MATVIVLKHPKPEDPERRPRHFPALRLTLTGATLITDLDAPGSNTQTFPSREAATETLERVLRLRRDEGYRILEKGEIDAGEAELVGDPLAGMFRYEEERRRAYVDLEEAPISPEELEEIVARLVAAAPRCIDHVRGDELPGGILAAALGSRVLPSVRSLVFVTNLPLNYPRLPLDDLADLFAALPNLERAEAVGQWTLREANHDTLRELFLENRHMVPWSIAALGDGSLPALTRLALVLGRDHGMDRMSAAAIRSLAAPRLQEVEVSDVEDLTHFLAELTERPLPPSWTTLCAHGSVGDEDALLALLRERAPALGGLATLGLPLADELSEGGVAEAKARIPQTVDISDLPDRWSPTLTETW